MTHVIPASSSLSSFPRCDGSTVHRAAALLENGRAVVIQCPTPVLEPGQVRVSVRASLISPGTELGKARQQRAAGRKDPGQAQPFGYQNAGVVLEVGPGVSRFNRGDRVACMGMAAGHAERACVPQNLVTPIADHVPFEDAAYCHLIATALQAIHRSQPALGEWVLVSGLGIVGQLCVQLAKLSGAYVLAADALDSRLSLAVRLGADAALHVGVDDPVEVVNRFTRRRGLDLAVLAYGGTDPMAMSWVHPLMRLTPDLHREARVIVVGGLQTEVRWGSGMGNLTVMSSARTGPGYHDDDWEHGRVEYPYPWVRWSTRDHLALGMQLIAEGRLNVASLTTDRLPLDQVAVAVDRLIESPDRSLGCVLLMNESTPAPIGAGTAARA